MGRNSAAYCGFGALGLAVVLASTSAQAVEAATFSVDCPELSPELRSSLEARGLADLAAYGHTDLHWRVVCRAGEATVDSYSGSDLVRQSRVPLTGAPNFWVEQILAFLHEVVPCAEIRPAATAGGLSAAPSVQPPLAATTALPGTSSDAQSGATPAAPARNVTRSRLDPALAIDTELWSSAPLLLIGPSARLGIWLNSTLRIAPSFGAAWGSSRPSDMGVRLVAGGVDVSLGTRVWGSIGARLVWASLQPSSQFSPNANSLFEPEFAAKLGITLPLPNGSWSAALGVRAYSQSHDVRVNGASVLRVPLFAPVASLEYRFMPRD